jgi:hypothetical protein
MTAPSGSGTAREMVRVSLDRFNNRNTIDIRSWWRDQIDLWSQAETAGDP